MYQKRRDSACIRLIAPAANSLCAAAEHRTLKSRSMRMKVTSSFAFAAASNAAARALKRSRSSAVARRAALRAISRSSSRRTSSRRSWLVTLMSVTKMPRRGKIATSRSRASRCSASRIGVRPMPSRAESSDSEIGAARREPQRDDHLLDLGIGAVGQALRRSELENGGASVHPKP